jgi:hypothetical protein
MSAILRIKMTKSLSPTRFSATANNGEPRTDWADQGDEMVRGGDHVLRFMRGCCRDDARPGRDGIAVSTA